MPEKNARRARHIETTYVALAIEKLSAADHQLTLFAGLFAEDDSSPSISAATARRQIEIVLGELNAASTCLFEIHYPGKKPTIMCRADAALYDAIDTTILASNAVAGGKYPLGRGITNSPVCGAMSAVRRAVANILRNLRAVRAQSPGPMSKRAHPQPQPKWVPAAKRGVEASAVD